MEQANVEKTPYRQSLEMQQNLWIKDRNGLASYNKSLYNCGSDLYASSHPVILLLNFDHTWQYYDCFITKRFLLFFNQNENIVVNF